MFPENQDVVFPVSRALSKTGGVVGLKGNLAPDGAIVKVAGLKNQVFTGTRSASIARKTPSPHPVPRLQEKRRHRHPL